MKTKTYLKSLLAPLGMIAIFSCSPNQYQQSGEYDDVYFTKKDRKTKQEIVVDASATENPEALNTTNSSTATVAAELQEKYSGGSDDIVYFEDQGPRVKEANDLNYDDFVWDYNNENLAYYELPFDWDSDWNQSSFNDIMSNDFQFRLAWYEQYYLGDNWKMEQYLNGRTRQSTTGMSRVGIGTGFNTFNTVPLYYPGMYIVDLNPYGNWGMYDPFWSPIRSPWGYSRWRAGINFSIGFGGGWYDPWYCPPGFGGGFYGSSYYTNIYNRPIYINNGDINVNNRSVTRAARLNSTGISTVARDSQNGSQIRTRSQRAVRSSGVNSGIRTVPSRSITSGRNRSSSNSTLSRASLAASGNRNRVRTDNNRVTRSSSRLSRTSQGRQVASRSALSRPTSRTNSRASGTSRSSFTRADISRQSVNRNSRSSSGLRFDRNSSSRATSSRPSSRSSSSFSRNSGSRNSSFSRSSGTSSGRSSGFSRPSSSSRGSSGVSRSSGSRSSSSRGSVSSGSSRSGSSSSSSSGRGSSRSGGSRGSRN